MARLALVKVGDAHLSPRAIRAIEAAENGAVVVYEGGDRVGILGVSADDVLDTLNKALDHGAGSGFNPYGWPPA